MKKVYGVESKTGSVITKICPISRKLPLLNSFKKISASVSSYKSFVSLHIAPISNPILISS
jgi:hypothetical protein